MFYGYFVWWYGEGLRLSWRTAVNWLYTLADFFSVDLLIKTLFAPWKNDVVRVRNAALSDQLKVWEGNIASRLVGLVIRLLVIVISLLLLGLLSAVILLGFGLWLIVPILIIALPLAALGVA